MRYSFSHSRFKKALFCKVKDFVLFSAVALHFGFFQEKADNAEMFRRGDYRLCLIYHFLFHSHYEVARELCVQRKATISR